jgi:SAM-dependent methyltransferase
MNLQKLNDIYDWFDPALDTIIRDHLKAAPVSGRRQWEFAMIFRAIKEAGLLHSAARGLGVGSGTERLIFSLAPLVGHLTVTDLYEKPEGWAGVRTDDPQKHVMSKAPWPIPQGRIKALTMDMRKLDLPENAFDFAWSTGAIEHIGSDEDFVTHFNEIHRALKPGGVYALTTVCCFRGATDRLPHNYYFDPNHLMDLAHASRLHPEPEFDCRIREHTLNRPMVERCGYYGFRAGDLFVHPVVSLRRGIVTAANTVIFRKKEGPKVRPKVIGLEETRKWVDKGVADYLRLLWRDWQSVHEVEKKSPPQQFLPGFIEVDAPAPVVVHSQAVGFPVDKKVEKRLKAGLSKLRVAADRLYIFKCDQPVRVRRLAPRSPR